MKKSTHNIQKKSSTQSNASVASSQVIDLSYHKTMHSGVPSIDQTPLPKLLKRKEQRPLCHGNHDESNPSINENYNRLQSRMSHGSNYHASSY